eukprot:TRINITY_DN24743_c0_g1_i1.p1 TRINITY_DN24743_c0_g1~~TRINITY_DN24743_c0_g1_i1.p1  ORF type:complete len:156 (+),score=30.85 TRINITY_DN24743_c0_g1_i1:47-469(+)
MSLQYGVGGTRLRKIYGGEESGKKPLPPIGTGKGSCHRKHAEGSEARQAIFGSSGAPPQALPSKRPVQQQQQQTPSDSYRGSDYRFKSPTAALSITRKPVQQTQKPTVFKAPSPTFSLEWQMTSSRHPNFTSRNESGGRP